MTQADNDGRSPPFQTVNSRVVWTCPWFSVRQDQIVLPDGRPGVYNVVQHPGAAWVVPVTTAGEVLLIRHYRYAVDDWCWEVPAGGIREGQTPFEVAREELKQEVGGEATDWEYVGRFYTSNGISNEVGHAYLATGVVQGATGHEPAEVLEIHPTPVEEALAMAQRGEITDGPSALALLLCEAHLRGL